MQKSKIFCLFAFILFTGSTWYSVTQYQTASGSAKTEFAFLDKKIVHDDTIVPNVDLEKLLGIEKFSKYQAMDSRDLFSKFKPKKIEPVKPAIPKTAPKAVKKVLPKVEPEPVIEEPKIKYFYRGTMMVDGVETHIVEQENPYKWHFLKPEGGKNQDLSLVDVGRYGVTVSNKDGEIIELTIKKEF